MYRSNMQSALDVRETVTPEFISLDIQAQFFGVINHAQAPAIENTAHKSG